MRKCLKWTRLPLTEGTEPLVNPWRGLYTLYKFHLSEDLAPETGTPIERTPLDSSQSLCLVEINLSAFVGGTIAREALDRADRILAFFSENGRDMILRFLYDWDGIGLHSEPDDINVILEHMRQLAPLLKRRAHAIYILQGLFIGSWGEMHGSRYLGERSLKRLAQTLHECSGPESFLAVRSPSLWRGLFDSCDPPDGRQAFSGSMQARFGLFNDAILGSETDLGTYGDADTCSDRPGDRLCREEELAFQNALCRFVPNGGEALHGQGLTGFAHAVQSLRRMRVSYLNAAHDPWVWEAWREAKVPLAGPWHGRSVRDYLAAHLGYRFVVTRAALRRQRGKGTLLLLRIILANLGFSACYRALGAWLVAEAEDGARSIALDWDARHWAPGEPVALEVRVDASDWAPGSYALGLRLADLTGKRPVFFANAPTPRDHDGILFLGTLRLPERR